MEAYTIIKLIFIALVISVLTCIIVGHIKENREFCRKIKDFKVGDRYQSCIRQDDPFKKTIVYEMEIVEIRDGWAKYRWGDGSGSSEPIERIVRMYVKKTLIMTQIKSEKAECLLNAAKQSNVNGCPVSLGVATQSVIFAEQEAEERHAKELQELKDKAVEWFRDFVTNYAFEAGYTEIERNAEHHIKIFTQRLTEQ